MTSPSPARMSSISGFDGVDRDGEADVLGVADDRGVDADDGAVGGDERPAGVAGVDGGVGLDEVVEADAAAVDLPVEGRDDAPGDGRLAGEVEGVADGDDLVADLQVGRVAERRRHQAVGVVDPDEGDVVVGEAADELGVGRRAVEEADGDRLRRR